MDCRELRRAYLEFFQSKGHALVDSSSLVPDNDPTLLFTNAGMVQFKEALAFRENRGYTRAASCQRCVRAGGKHNDLDNVGYTARHHTFFEMLGNFSFGDYFKEEAIAYAWEFLTEVIGLPAERLWITVHESDDEAARIWIDDIGVNPERVSRLGDDDNFWTMGDTGPCGPSSEIFYDHGPDIPGGPPGSEDGELDRYIEIWNLVFTQFDRSANGTLTPLPKPCVDTGMGLERLAAVLQGVHNNYEIDLFGRLIKQAAIIIGTTELTNPSLKVIADHIRAASFLIADGVVPSNEGRGYVIRRIIRRALRHGHKLQSQGPFFHKLVSTLVEEMGDAYPLLAQTQSQIERVLLKEEQQFDLTLDQGMKILSVAIEELFGTEIPGEVVFKLYDTFGFPTDLTADVARERNLTIDMAGFDVAMEEQRTRARAASQFGSVTGSELKFDNVTEFIGYDSLQGELTIEALVVDGEQVSSATTDTELLLIVNKTPFYAESGGQVGDSGTMFADGIEIEILDTVKNGDAHVHQAKVVSGTVNLGLLVNSQVDSRLRTATRVNHSATHLMHAALKNVLGEHVNQRGSLVDAERLRFDFSHFEGVTPDQLREIERIVNDQVRANSAVETELMQLDDAKTKGAMALFGEKYSEEVRVLTMGGDFSIELCGGTHAVRTGEIGFFKITSEQGVASGVRRIEAVTGTGAMEYVEQVDDLLSESASLIKADRSNITEKVKALLEQNRKLEKSVSDLNKKLAGGGAEDLSEAAIEIEDFKLVVSEIDGADPKVLPDTLDRLKNKLGRGIVVLATVNEGKVGIIAGVTKDLTDKFNAGNIVNHVASQVGGKGGGRPDMARAGGSEPDKLPAALSSVEAFIRNLL